jgi:aerobic-type carbon monoxide dehydrogenase small subunit (CoxS/CutS family)
MAHRIRATVNGVERALTVASHETLLEMLSRQLGLRGAREVCGIGVCGACTILVDGDPVSSCTYLAAFADGRDVVTIEGLGAPGAWHPLQEAFRAHGAAQCGYCTPAMILAAKALLDRPGSPSDDEVREHLAGNLCRCGAYGSILAAVRAVRDGKRPASLDTPAGAWQ